jgi:WD40 repeat protein
MTLSSDKRVLALSRSNHSIEIWKADSFAQILIIPGNKNADLRNILWVEPNTVDELKSSNGNLLYYWRTKGKKVLEKKRRLVTTGLNGLVIEWDLRTGQPKHSYNAGGAIWDSKVVGKFIYLACEDGSIRIVKMRKRSIDLVKILAK